MKRRHELSPLFFLIMIEHLWVEYWEIHPYTVVAFLGYCLLTAIGNSLFLYRLGRRKSGLIDFPFVSILVPARNEEANIETCVRSLLAQEYPAFEVIVLNDQSTNVTGAIGHAPRALHESVAALLEERAVSLPGRFDGHVSSQHRSIRVAGVPLAGL